MNVGLTVNDVCLYWCMSKSQHSPDRSEVHDAAGCYRYNYLEAGG